MTHKPQSVRRFAFVAFLAFLIAMARCGFGFAQVSVTTQHNDNFRDGVNPNETTLTPSNVTVNQFGMLFKVIVDDQIFAQPLVDNITIAGATHNVVYLATTNNSVYAFDADTGAPYWHVNLGTAISKQLAGWGCNDVLGTSGIMSTPVIANGNLYVVAETFINNTANHQLHSLSLTTGAEQPGSPVSIQATGFNSKSELQRSGLLYANGNIYFNFAGHCDQGSWKGFTFAYNAKSLAQVGVFNASPDDNGSGIWQSGNGSAADASGNVYWVTGNGGWDGVDNFSETMLKANANLGLVDWHTPSDYSSLDKGDLDLTTSGPMLIAGGNLLVSGGKDGVLQVVNPNNMGHLGDSSAVQSFRATTSHIHSMNFFDNRLYVWGQNDYMRVFWLVNGGKNFSTVPYTGHIQALGHPGASLSISANGTSNGILWAATNSQGQANGYGAWFISEPGILYAYDATTFAQLWTNEINPARDDCNFYAKFTAPTIANGKVYLPSFGTAQTQSGQMCVYGEFLIPDGKYIMTNLHSGMVVLDPGSSTTPGVDMQQAPVNKATNQQWTVTNLGQNVITLTNVASGLVMEVAGSSKAKNALVDQQTYSGLATQQWSVSSVSPGVFVLTNLNSGYALEVDGGTTASQVDQFPNQGQHAQQWKFASQ